MAVYDCFTFFNELDLLEARLNILNDVVDKFVIVEATRTHSNKEKSLIFMQERERFNKFQDKIIHIVVSNYPTIESSWTIENHQRNCISYGLANCKDDDTIIISDLDEIPNPETIFKYKNEDGIIAFQQNVFYYYFNNMSTEYWISPKMLLFKNFKNILNNVNNYGVCLSPHLNQGTTASKIRLYHGDMMKIVKNGGWHFAYIMDANMIAYKIQSFSHQEFNSHAYTNKEAIEEKMKDGMDLYNRPDFKYTPVKITFKDFPAYIVNNQEKFSKYIIPDAKYTVNDLQQNS